MGALITITESIGLRFLQASTSEGNDGAINLFERWGFRRNGRGGEGVIFICNLNDVQWN